MKLPFNKVLTIDAETRWSSKAVDWAPEKYSLSFSTTEEYIRSPLFKAFGFCIHEYGSSTPTQWYSHKELPRIFKMYDWSTTAVLAQNSVFDVSILSFIYGIKPCFIFDTLSMARALRGAEGGNSLMKLAEDYGLPPKGHAVHSTDGLFEIPPWIEQELATYCAHDVYLCEQIFSKLLYRIAPDGTSAGKFPMKELRLIDMTCRMYTDPVLVLDRPLLEKALGEETEKLKSALERTGVEASELASNDQFAEVLRKLGAFPPTKTSKVTGKEAFAFAKNDALFQAMLNGDDEDIALICEARLKVKSTLERTRAQRFIDIAGRGTLPVPLSYYGAATGRWAAAKGANLNLQNMKRGSFLRKAIMAPDGHMLAVADLSQIEPRVLAWLSDYDALLDIFRAGGDPYAKFGEGMFSLPGMTKESHPIQRQASKSALIGANYQLGWAAFAAQLLVGFLGADPKRYTKAEAQQLGVTAQMARDFLAWHENVAKMNEIPHTCTEEELLIHCLAAKAIVDKYRDAADPVVQFWSLLGHLIERSLVGGEEYNHKDVLLFRKEEIVMANGMSLRYPGIEVKLDEKDRPQYSYQDGKKRRKLYPGKICNNVTQGSARIVMSDGLLRIDPEYRVLGTVHDECISLVPEKEAQQGYKWMLQQMTLEPKWLPGIPLAADGGVHKSYGLAKK